MYDRYIHIYDPRVDFFLGFWELKNQLLSRGSVFTELQLIFWSLSRRLSGAAVRINNNSSVCDFFLTDWFGCETCLRSPKHVLCQPAVLRSTLRAVRSALKQTSDLNFSKSIMFRKKL